jgi:secondary thiamine-phosphate synthase enzyme
MKQIIEKLTFNTNAGNILEITEKILEKINILNLNSGLINLSILHTSCSLMIQENADNTVLVDIKNYLNEIVPENTNYAHSAEGSDDMPAHLKTLLTQTNLTLSLKNKNLILGTWQGIFLIEHRKQNKIRDVMFHFLGE